ncbi:hypothetical protein JKF63_04015 [Porcisia hertigi]|uniref:Uncharacterized protein n=1 Tax=Porcisia hertigi TaxID=2761500 RepID=A0A836ICF8_9TRYP|nr:hypothetical protein JKF63_04014 [Porcisia hertigi]KAG5497748.1 hypothetical protein JKF63_04015 [Porcisia hertigi]
MEPANISVEASMRYLTELGYSVSAPLHAADALAANTETQERSLCDGFVGSYSMGLHVGSLFLILFVSFLGTAIPILGKCIPGLMKYPFVFSVMKSAATGVLLSVSTIHLIFEGAEAFAEKCIPSSLTSYGPLYFLFALIAALLMQALDMQLADIAERWMRSKRKAEAAMTEANTKNCEQCCELSAKLGIEAASGSAQAESPMNVRAERSCSVFSEREREGRECEGDVKRAAPNTAFNEGEEPVTTLIHDYPERHHQSSDSGAHGHQHLTVAPPTDMGSIRRVVSAVCMEFGVTLHSVFVGLAVGLTTDNELKPLIVALVFHQLFEGMAMGSRLVDAEFKGSLDIILALVFSFSAPAGMAASAIAVSASPSAMSGGNFVAMIAILDSMCGGILLYLAFTLLLGDFVADVKHYCAEGQKYRTLKKIVLFAAVWLGMGLMALVGNWL